MKKLLKLALLAVCATALFSCGPSNGGSSSQGGQPGSSDVQSSEQTNSTWTVEFMLNNGTEDVYKTVDVENNKAITTTIGDPTRNGFTFSGWYLDKECTKYFDEAGDVVTSNLKVYAKWVSSGITNPDTPGENTSSEDNPSSENSGNEGESSGNLDNELPGTTDAPTDGYALLFNGTNYVVLTPEAEKDFQGRDQFSAKGVTVSEGQVFVCYNGSNGDQWVEKVLEPYGVCEPSGTVAFEVTEDGIKCLVSGTYDIYVKMKWEDNTIYIGAAA
ncbi:MAG: hypothetical protein E7177_02595 [Erysipelotrichaceae bacterium]|nr:hypothetical protein [Erysipelotrichaceae bacterium]